MPMLIEELDEESHDVRQMTFSAVVSCFFWVALGCISVAREARRALLHEEPTDRSYTFHHLPDAEPASRRDGDAEISL